MHISARGLALIEGFEGFSSRPYWDPYGGVWTRGYGETEGLHVGSPSISRAHAQARLRELVQARYEPAIRALDVEFNQNQWDALCSFAYNLGAGIFTGNLRAALGHQDWNAAARVMLCYDHAGGRALLGLERRRRAEVDLFLKPIPPFVPADEARWEHEYDQLLKRRDPWARTRRRVLRRYMTRRLVEVLHAADQHGGWGKLNREARYRSLLERTR